VLRFAEDRPGSCSALYKPGEQPPLPAWPPAVIPVLWRCSAGPCRLMVAGVPTTDEIGLTVGIVVNPGRRLSRVTTGPVAAARWAGAGPLCSQPVAYGPAGLDLLIRFGGDAIGEKSWPPAERTQG